MPNWCENDLAVNGPDEEIDRMLKAVFSKDKEDESVCLFPDFDKIIPYPANFKELDEQAKSEQEKIEKMSPEERTLYVNEHGHYKDGYNLGGYEWCVANWGTKWSAKEPRQFVRAKKKVSLSFDTAWSPPFPIINALSSKFPVLKFSLKYYERGMGFSGKLVCSGGEVVEEAQTDYQGSRGG